MWSINQDAPTVADHVYADLFSNAEPDGNKALHHAVKLLRQQIWDSALVSAFYTYESMRGFQL